MIEWDAFKGLGIDRKKLERQRPTKPQKPKLSYVEKRKNRIKRATRYLLNKKWIGRGSFFLAHKEYLKSPKWKSFRKAILERSEGFCEYCFKKSSVLHVHHLTYERWGNERAEDVMALCEICHEEIHD